MDAQAQGYSTLSVLRARVIEHRGKEKLDGLLEEINRIAKENGRGLLYLAVISAG